MNKKNNIIFCMILFVFAGLFIFCMNYFSAKYNLNEATSVGIIGGADGPTAIYIREKHNWQNILFYSLIVVIIDLIIFRIIEKIGKKRQKLFLRLSKLIIVIFNLLVIMFFFISNTACCYSIVCYNLCNNDDIYRKKRAEEREKE